jgi:hypothetical protein
LKIQREQDEKRKLEVARKEYQERIMAQMRVQQKRDEVEK